jgi:hypothetical protein
MKVKNVLELLRAKYDSEYVEIFHVTASGNRDIQIWHPAGANGIRDYINDLEIENDCVLGVFVKDEYLTVFLDDEIYKQREHKLNLLFPKVSFGI